MEKKICSKCGEEKELNEFFFRNKKENKRHSQCKVCYSNNRRGKEHYEKYKDEYIARAMVRNKRVLSENKIHMMRYLNNHPCVDCGESDPIVLEFDHLDRSKKEYNISVMLQNCHSWSSIMEEINKCEVVCANCHKKRTANQFNWYKIK